MIKSHSQKFLLIPIFLQLIWGFIPSASKLVLDEIPVELYIAIRWTISGLIFAGYIYWTKSWKPISKKVFISVAALGILGYALGSFGTLYGLKMGGVVNFALISAINPLIYTLVAIWLLKEKPSPSFLLALPVAIFGLALLVIGKYQLSSISIAGFSSILIMSSIVLEAIVFMYSKKYKEMMKMTQYLAISQIAAAIIMWGMQFAVFHQTSQISQLTMSGFSALMFVAIGACVLYYVVFYWLLTFIDGHRLALIDGFHVVSASIFGYFLFNEPVQPLTIVGGLLVIIGLIAGNWPKLS